LSSLGEYDKALPLYEEAKEIRERLLTKNHPDYAMSCGNLAYLWESKGEYDKALPLYEISNVLVKQT
jgi:tetratricopeptide (TPR) repeat protein